MKGKVMFSAKSYIRNVFTVACFIGLLGWCGSAMASPKIVSMTVTQTSPSPTLAGSNATYNVVVNYSTGAGFDGLLSQTNTLPAGVTVAFSPATLTIPKGTGSLTATMTVGVPAGLMTTNVGLCVLAAVDKQPWDNAGDCGASLSVVSTNPPSCSITGPAATNAFTAGIVYTDTTDAATPSFSWSITGNGAIAGATTNQSVTVNAGAVGSFDLTCLVIDLANGKSNTCSRTVTINKADPTVTTWPTASAITYGQTLADSTLTGGTASVLGTFTFTTPSTAPNAGTAAQSVTFTPDDTANYNTVVGSVNVTVNKATPTVTEWPTASAITFGQTLADSTLTGGTASVPGGFAFTTPTTAPNAGTAAQSVTFTPNDTANYNTVIGSADVTVNKATPSVTVWPSASAITYGQTLANSTLSGGSSTPTGTFTFTTPSTAPNAGTAAQSVTFTPDDTANFNTVVGSVDVTVNKANPSVTEWPAASAITYGQTLADSTLTGGTASVPGAFAFTTPATVPNAGTAAQSVTFTPNDTANYNTVIGSADVTVNKADPSVTTWPTASAITYGQTLADSTLSGGVATPDGNFAFTTPTTAPNAGTAAQSVTFTPNDTANYNTVVGSADVTVNKADPSVTTWPTASAITFGQTLADSTLSGGVATPDGNFAFTTPTTAPNVGTAAQSVTFTPNDTANYNTVVGSADVTVNKADPTVTTWPTASAITFGQTLADSTLSGGVATPDGNFAFTTPTTAPNVGTAPQSVTFTPNDTANYNTVTSTVDVTVNPVSGLVTTWPTATAITYGQTLADSTLSGGTASVPGTFNFTTPTTAPNAGTAPQSVTFTPDDTVNYSPEVGSVNVTVNKADPSVTTWPTASAITYGQTLADSTLSGGVATPDGNFAFTTPTTAPNAGTAAQSVTFTPNDTANYNTVVSTVNVTVNKADPSVTAWPTASSITNGQSLADSTLSGGTASVPGEFVFTTPTTIPGVGTSSQSVTFTPTDTANYNTVVGTVDVTVVSGNGAPVANDYTASVNEDATLDQAAPGGLSVVTDPDNDPLTAILVSSPTNGTLVLNSNGSFVYTPNANFNGTDTFTFKASDGTNESNVATATITVNAVADAPVAQPDTYATPQDTLLSVAVSGVLTNDSDADGDSITASVVDLPAHGTLTLNSNGSFEYQPTAGYNGYDVFTYVATDGDLQSETTTVTIAVGNVNTAPVANADSYEVAEDDELVIAAPGVLGNDVDAQDDALTASVVVPPAHGTLTLNPNGSFTYVPANNYNGPDSFTYKANDGEFDSNVATVNIAVTPVDGAGDIDLYSARASFKQSWTRTHSDRFQIKGRINPRGANENLAGATMLVTLNGVDLYTPIALDSHGFGVFKLGSVKVIARFNSKTGQYRYTITGTNLRPNLSFPNISRTDTTVLNVQVAIAGAGLDIPVVAAQLETGYTTKANKGTTGKFYYMYNRTLTGVFSLKRTKAKQLTAGTFDVRAQGYIENEGGSAVIPSGPLTIQIGGATYPVPQKNVKVLVQANGLYVKIRAKNLANTGIPLAGGSAPSIHDLPVQVIVPVTGGTQTFDTIIELKRNAPTSKSWKR
jgi:VCBS repeat-containing protein